MSGADSASGSLVPEAFHRVQGRGPLGRKGTEPDSHRATDQDGDECAEDRNWKLVVSKESHREGKSYPDQGAHGPSGNRDEDRFGKELQGDVLTGRSYRFAYANLMEARTDRGEHDIHDPDSANDKRNRREQSENDGQRIGRLLGHRQYLGKVPHL